MTISNPHIYRDGFYYRCIKRTVNNYCEHYNQDKRSGQQLKSQHRRLIRTLVRYAGMVIEENRKAFNKDGLAMEYTLGTWERINLSRFLEAIDLEVHPDTIKRYKKRLIDAGVIKASCQDFAEHKTAKKRRSDVLINPELLLIYDLDNPDYIPQTQFFSETDLLALNNVKRAGCIGVSGKGLPTDQNNRIMDVDNVDPKGVILPNADQPGLPDQDLLPDTTTKQGELGQESKQKVENFPTPSPVKTAATQQPDQSSARPAPENPKRPDSLADMRLSFARTFYIYLVNVLFTKHHIFSGEAQKAIEYMTQTYFSTIQSEHHGRYLLKRYKQRADLAASYIKRKNFDFSNIYPCAYLNVNNAKGFAATKGWLDAQHSYKVAQAAQKQQYAKLLEEKKVVQQLQSQYQENPTISEFNRAVAFLNSRLPHMTSQYLQNIGCQPQITNQ